MRFIPTYVGHTGFPLNGMKIYSVHPHIRGAYLSDQVDGVNINGSSPHTWGILIFVGVDVCCGAVHPHIRGAYCGPETFPVAPTGSSPHTWGIQIPYRTWQNWELVHPHIRGAYYNCINGETGRYGSSPHTWGIRSGRWGMQNEKRFIPTYVGHTKTCHHRVANYAVHPHIRGAYAQS